MAAEKAPSPAMEFLVSALKANRNAVYADLKAKAKEKRLKVFPVMYGRAKAMLGLVKVAKYGTGKFARANAAKVGGATGRRGRPTDGSSKSGQVRELLASGMTAAEIAKKVGCTVGLVYVVKSTRMHGRRGPGRPRTVAGSGLHGLEGILDAVKNSQRERERMQAALEKIQAVIADALG
jgi:hypothetical protein